MALKNRYLRTYDDGGGSLFDDPLADLYDSDPGYLGDEPVRRPFEGLTREPLPIVRDLGRLGETITSPDFLGGVESGFGLGADLLGPTPSALGGLYEDATESGFIRPAPVLVGEVERELRAARERGGGGLSAALRDPLFDERTSDIFLGAVPGEGVVTAGGALPSVIGAAARRTGKRAGKGAAPGQPPLQPPPPPVGAAPPPPIPPTRLDEIEEAMHRGYAIADRGGKQSGILQRGLELGRNFVHEGRLATWNRFADTDDLMERYSKQLGRPLTDEEDAAMWIRLHGGRGEAGLAMLDEGPGAAFREVSATGIDRTTWDDIIRLEREAEIFRLKPGRTVARGDIRDPAEPAALLQRKYDAMTPAQRQAVDRGRQAMKAFHELNVDADAAAGLISANQARDLKQHFNYVPIQVLHDIYDGKYGGTGRGFAVRSSGVRKLADTVADAIKDEIQERPTRALQRQTIAREARRSRNRVMRGIMQAAQADPILSGSIKPTKDFGDTRNHATWMEDGVKRVAFVEKDARWIADLANNIDEETGKLWAGIMTAGRVVNWAPRQAFVERNPAFALTSNMPFDLMVSFVTSLNNPLSSWAKTAGVLYSKATGKKYQLFDDFLKAGGGQATGFHGNVKVPTLDDMFRTGEARLSPRNVAEFMRDAATLQWVSDLGQGVELGPRLAAFERARKKGASPQRAALAGRESTIDFYQGGYASRALNSWALFFNATVQGPRVILNAMKNDASARWRAGAITALAASTYLWNRQHSEYYDVPKDARWGELVIMYGSKEQEQRKTKDGTLLPLRIDPRTGQPARDPVYARIALRDFAAVVAPIQLMLASALGDVVGNHDTRDDPRKQVITEDAWSVMELAANRMSPVDLSLGGAFTSLYPIPVGKAMEVAFNRDFFRNRDIVPIEQRGRPPDEQFNEWTTETAKVIAKQIGGSPLAVEHIIAGTLGSMGRNALQSVDEHILRLKRQSASGVPVLGAVAGRLQTTRGGGLRDAAREIASKELGQPRIEQTREADRLIAQAAREADMGQVRVDQRFLDRLSAGEPNAGREWREARRAISLKVQGQIEQIYGFHPQAIRAGRERERYQEIVATMGGVIPDARQRTDVLVASYRAIEPPQDKWGNDDFRSFMRQRQAFLDALAPNERREVESRLREHMTSVERTYVEQAIPQWLTYQRMQREDVSKLMGMPRAMTETEWDAMRAFDARYDDERDPMAKALLLQSLGPHAGTFLVYNKMRSFVSRNAIAFASGQYRLAHPVMKQYGLVG